MTFILKTNLIIEANVLSTFKNFGRKLSATSLRLQNTIRRAIRRKTVSFPCVKRRKK